MRRAGEDGAPRMSEVNAGFSAGSLMMLSAVTATVPKTDVLLLLFLLFAMGLAGLRRCERGCGCGCGTICCCCGGGCGCMAVSIGCGCGCGCGCGTAMVRLM